MKPMDYKLDIYEGELGPVPVIQLQVALVFSDNVFPHMIGSMFINFKSYCKHTFPESSLEYRC